MSEEDAILRLKELQKSPDHEAAHMLADVVLLDVLEAVQRHRRKRKERSGLRFQPGHDPRQRQVIRTGSGIAV